ncbi:MAG: FAD binding domain-containing protein [Rhodomicrobium sp.]
MNRFAWVSPHNVREAAASASALVADAITVSGAEARGASAIIKAGGIDILDLMKENLLAPANVISLSAIPGLETIAEDPNGGLRIGTMATLARIATNPQVRKRYPALAEAALSSASPQIRNVATLGGNLLQRPRCWYFRSIDYHCLRKGGGHCFALSGENQYHAIFGNMPCAIVHPSTAATALVALGASVELTKADGTVRVVLLEDFFVPVDRDLQRENDLKTGEILTAILLPPLPAATRMAHLKQGEKDSFDWPLADVAVVLVLEPQSEGYCRSASIVLGAAAPVPHRAKVAESTLIGKRIGETIARAAASAALEGATPLAKNAYKLPLFEALVRRAVLKAAALG